MKLLCIFVFLILKVSLLSCNEILTVKEKELSVIEVPNNPYKLRIVYMASNATVQSSIQVRKVYDKKIARGDLTTYIFNGFHYTKLLNEELPLPGKLDTDILICSFYIFIIQCSSRCSGTWSDNSVI